MTQKIEIEYIIECDIKTSFEELTKKIHFDKSIDDTLDLTLIREKNEEYEQGNFKLGNKRLVSYGAINGYLNGESEIIITEYVKPYNITEYWRNGFFKEAKFKLELIEDGQNTLAKYIIEYELKLPSVIGIIKKKIEKNKIEPIIHEMMNNRWKHIEDGFRERKIHTFKKESGKRDEIDDLDNLEI